MNARGIIVVALALVCGLSAVFLVKALRSPVAAPTVERTGVVFAIEDVKTGEMVGATSVEVRQVPVADVPEDAIRKVDDALDRAAKSTIDKGDMLRARKLAEKGAGRGMAALIRPGMRAFTIQTPSFSSSLAGFLLPGNKVDVLLTATSTGPDAAGETTLTLLQDVEILAVHTNVGQPSASKINPDDARSVTLQVTPEDARRLDLGQNRGTLHLSLRNPADKGRDTSGTATLADIQGLRPKAAAAPTVRPLSESIRPGMRAFTIDSERFSGTLAGYLVADSRVDILLTAETDAEDKRLTGGSSTMALLKDIKILAVQPKAEGPDIAKAAASDARFVTLEVTPDQALRLDLAQKVGKLHISLRGDKEKEADPAPGAGGPSSVLASLVRRVLDRNAPATDPAPALDPAGFVVGGRGMAPGVILASDLAMTPPKREAAAGGPRVMAVMQVRTLRGTQAGVNNWMVYEPVPGAPYHANFRVDMTAAK